MHALHVLEPPVNWGRALSCNARDTSEASQLLSTFIYVRLGQPGSSLRCLPHPIYAQHSIIIPAAARRLCVLAQPEWRTCTIIAAVLFH